MQSPDYDEEYVERLRKGESLTFTNKNFRMEKYKNENSSQMEACSADYFESSPEPTPRVYRTREYPDNIEYPESKNLTPQLPQNDSALYVSQIENSMPGNHYDSATTAQYKREYLSQCVAECKNVIMTYYQYYQYYQYSLNQLTMDPYYNTSAYYPQNSYQYSNQRVASYSPPVEQYCSSYEMPEMPVPKAQPTPPQQCTRQQKVWEGDLPKRKKLPGDNIDAEARKYSKKVFIGGVPWDITEDQLRIAFEKYGRFTVKWPTRDSNTAPNVRIKGHLYLIFEESESVNNLIDQVSTGCEVNGGSITFNYRIKCNRNKHVQIVPWLLSDNYWEDKNFDENWELRTIFVGGLHGKLYAQALFQIFDELFKNVVAVKIDTDDYNYPTGSGSITFRSNASYKKAIEANHIVVKTSAFGSKSIEIQHFMEDKPCSMCKNVAGKKFCKTECFDYFCDGCWRQRHRSFSVTHVCVTRNHKNKNNDYLL